MWRAWVYLCSLSEPVWPVPVLCGLRAQKMQFSEELKYYFRVLRYLESNATYWQLALQQNVRFSQNMLVMLVNDCYMSGKHCISPEIGNRTRLNIFWKLWNKYSGTIHIIPKWSHDMAGIFVYMFIKKILVHRNILKCVLQSSCKMFLYNSRV